MKIAKLKIKNYDIQARYFRRAQIIGSLLRLAPFVRMVGINGSLPMGKATKESDIDFFIVTKKKRLWTGRFFAILFVQAIGLRRYGKKIAGRICLNRYQTEDYLIIHPQDKKNAFHHSFMIPLWQADNLYGKFIKANKWFSRYGYKFKNQLPDQNLFWNFLDRSVQFIGELIFDFFLGDWGEKKLGQYQKERIRRDPRTKKSPKGSIFVSDKELRFHPPKKP